MKRELVAIIILLAILGLSIFNIWSSDNKISKLTADIDAAKTLFDAGNTAEAAELLDSSLQIWLKWGYYTDIMLRQSEADEIATAYYELLDKVQKGDAISPASYNRLKERLHSIAELEKINIRNIF